MLAQRRHKINEDMAARKKLLEARRREGDSSCRPPSPVPKFVARKVPKKRRVDPTVEEDLERAANSKQNNMRATMNVSKGGLPLGGRMKPKGPPPKPWEKTATETATTKRSTKRSPIFPKTAPKLMRSNKKIPVYSPYKYVALS